MTIGYQGLPYKASGESQTGIQVSDGVLLHVGAGAEAGYDTNVFYSDSAIRSGRRSSARQLFADSPTRPAPGAASRIVLRRCARASRTGATSRTTRTCEQLSATPGCRRRGLALERGRRPVRLRHRRHVRPPRGSALQRRRSAGSDHPLQQPGVGRRALGAGRRSADRDAALHEHGRHLPGRRTQLRQHR